MAQKPSSSPDPGFQEVTMSLLQGNDLYQKADHRHPAFRPSGVMNSHLSEVTETDEDVLILNVPDDVRESLHPEIDRFFVKIEATRRSGSYLNEPKGWNRILGLAMAAVAMGGGLT
jgi:hypothetical protein